MAEAKKEDKKPKKVDKFREAEKFCPKCGVRMGVHADRYTCGRCRYTEWKKSA